MGCVMGKLEQDYALQNTELIYENNCFQVKREDAMQREFKGLVPIVLIGS